jgi:hypothetical protein
MIIIITMFVITELQTIFHIQFVGLTVNFLRTKSHRLRYNNSLVIAMRACGLAKFSHHRRVQDRYCTSF